MHFEVHTKNTVNDARIQFTNVLQLKVKHLTNIIPDRNVHYVDCNRNYRLITSPLGSSYFPQPLLTLQQHAAHSHTHTHMHANTKRKTALCVLCKIYKCIHTHTCI